MVFERPEPEMGTEGDVLLKRIVAIIIDSILLFVVTAVLVGIFVAISSRLSVLGNLLGLLIAFAYFVYFEGESGQTIGKRVMDLVVVTEDGEPIDYGTAAIRTVLRIIDGLFLYLVGFIVVLVTDRKQRLGDIAADTVVVRTAG